MAMTLNTLIETLVRFADNIDETLGKPNSDSSNRTTWTQGIWTFELRREDRSAPPRRGYYVDELVWYPAHDSRQRYGYQGLRIMHSVQDEATIRLIFSSVDRDSLKAYYVDHDLRPEDAHIRLFRRNRPFIWGHNKPGIMPGFYGTNEVIDAPELDSDRVVNMLPDVVVEYYRPGLITSALNNG